VFTQADVDAGKLVYCDPVSDVSVAETRFQVSLRDENLAHAAAQGDIAISLFHPANVPDIADITSSPAAAAPVLPVMNGLSMDEQLKIQFACLSMNLGYIVWDYSSENSAVTGRSPSSGLTKSAYTNQYVPAYGVERRQILWTGYGNDKLSGGMEGDILVAGYGQDTLRGNGGSDLFLLTQISGGNVVIEDFSISDKDLIDLTPLFPAVSGLVTNYVSLAVVGTNTVLGINYSGDGIYFTNRTVTLSGIVLAPSSLGTLLADGYLRVGNLAVCPRVSISATIPSASENGPVAGEFTISRTGSTASDMVVNLQVSGSAANGIDYMLVGSQVVIPAGQVSATIAVTPYVDTASELKEVVQINVVPGAGYEVATASAQVTIDDLAPMISIEALEPLAVKNTLTPGIFLISRSGVLSRSVLVRLAIGGTATIGTDYTSVSAFVNFDVGQATALLTITPKPSGTLANGSESVEITIKPDTSYCVWTPASAKVVIVDELLTAGDWKMRTAAVGAMDLITFLHEDPGAKGYLNIQRYAYGLDPVDPGASSGKPVFTLGGIHPSLTFRRPLSVTDIDYIAEMSRDLKTWQSGPDYFEEFIHPDYTSRLDMVSYRVRQPITNMEPLFMRVRLEYAP
jgi:hypothetical protein